MITKILKMKVKDAPESDADVHAHKLIYPSHILTPILQQKVNIL